MLKNNTLISVFTLIAFANIIILLYVLNIWYINPRNHFNLSPGIRILSERIHQRNILGHQPGSTWPHHKILYIVRNSDVARNNRTKVTLTSRKPTTSPLTENFDPILDIIHKIFSGSTDSIKRLAIKNKRLDRIYDVWNVTFNPIKSICKPFRDEVIVVVNSAPVNFEARAVIRNTWGKAFLSGNYSRLVFFIGQAKNSSVQRVLETEESREGDIVRADFQEDYHNLTLKSVLILRWLNLNCPGARFVIKVDDDVFLNVKNLQTALEESKTLKTTIFGKLARWWTPVRSNDSHYFVPESSWAASVYPDFVAGPAYVMSGDVVPLLLTQVSSVPYFYLEDVYVTGMCAQKAGVSRVQHQGFKALAKPLNPCSYHRLVTAHGLNPQEMTRIWGLLQKYGPKAKGCWEEKCVWNWLGVCVDKKRTVVDFGKESE